MRDLHVLVHASLSLSYVQICDAELHSFLISAAVPAPETLTFFSMILNSLLSALALLGSQLLSIQAQPRGRTSIFLALL